MEYEQAAHQASGTLSLASLPSQCQLKAQPLDFVPLGAPISRAHCRGGFRFTVPRCRTIL